MARVLRVVLGQTCVATVSHVHKDNGAGLRQVRVHWVKVKAKVQDRAGIRNAADAVDKTGKVRSLARMVPLAVRRAANLATRRATIAAVKRRHFVRHR